MLRLVLFSLLVSIVPFVTGCKDHNREEAERAGTPAPNQRAPTPEGTYR
jgi:hypothetical protein